MARDYVRRGYLIILILLVSLLTSCANGIVAKVNDEEIRQDELDKQIVLAEISYNINGYKFPKSGDQLQTVTEDIINNIIESRIMVDLSVKEGIEIDEDAAQSQGDSLIDGLITILGSEGGYEEYLKERGQDRIEFEEYIHELAKNNECIFNLYDKVTEEVRATKDEVREHYNNNTLNYNYSTRSAMAIQSIDEERATEIYNEISENQIDFKDAVDKYSGTQDVVNSVDLGDIYYNAMPEAFSNTAFSLEVDTFSEPVEVEDNYYIIYIYGKHEVEPIPFEEIKDTVESDIVSIKKTEVYEGYIEVAKNDYKIDIY